MRGGPPIVYEREPGGASAPLSPNGYHRREPEKTALYGLVAAELQSLIIGLDDDRRLPRFIERERVGYLGCGILSRGFSRVRCRDCRAEMLVAFSCRGRGVCPSCTTRRMVDLACHLVDRVIPRVPVRQWVITFPPRIRWHLAQDPKLAAEAITLCTSVLFAWQRRCARKRGVDFNAPKRSQSARNASVVFPQRFNSALQLSFHLHALLADGVFERTAGRPRFHRLPPPTDQEVDNLLAKIVATIVDLLRRRGRLDDPSEEPGPDELTWIHAAASRKLPSPRVELPPPPPLCARRDGFTLHAATAVHENDREGLERLARYCARPALSPSRMSIDHEGLVHYRMKRTFSDGRTEVVLEPRDFLVRLCALIPPPRFHMVRYFGAFAPGAADRRALTGSRPKTKKTTTNDTPPPPKEPRPAKSPPPWLSAPSGQAPSASPPAVPLPIANLTLGSPPPDPDRPPRLDWASLLQRVHKIDVLACPCGGPLKVIAFLTDTRVCRKILDHLGFAPQLPVPRPARAPPQPHLPGLDAPSRDPHVDPPSPWN